MHRRFLLASTLAFLGPSCFLLNAQIPSKDNGKPDPAEEAVVFEQASQRIRFESDGTGTRQTSAVIRIQSEGGVQEFGQLIFGYSSAFESLDVDYVRVRKPTGEVVVTPATSLQDFAPEILKQAPMYSDYREKHVSVSGLRPGDTLEYQTTIHLTTPSVPREFWYEYSFPRDIFVNEGRLEIDLPTSRSVHLKSPDHKYETKETGDRRVYTWIERNIAPEPRSERQPVVREERRPDIQLTTFTDWQQLARWYAKLQDPQAAANEQVRKKAGELIRGASGSPEKTQRLYDFVSRNIRYVSLSFGLGRYQPHLAEEVLQNGYGDCKDKHTLLQALLRAAGIESYPVLISSDTKLDPDVPSPAQFDHLITAVRLSKDKDLTWLDSTPGVAPYGLIMYQLRNKQALIASLDENAGLHLTPANSPVRNTETLTIDGKFSERGALDATVELTATGDSGLPLRMVFLQVSQANWKRVIEFSSAFSMGLRGDISDIRVDPLEDTSKPFHLRYHYHQDRYFIVPGSQDQPMPLQPLAVRTRNEGRKPTEPLDVGPAMEASYRAHYQLPDNFNVRVPLPVRLSRDYAEYSAIYDLGKNTLQAERHLVLKVNELPASRKSDFESLSSVLREDAAQLLSCVTVTGAHPAAESSAEAVSDKPEELMKAGNSALQRKDFKSAADLFKRILDQEPAHEDAWDRLGRAYAGMSNHEQAIAAFRKQTEVNAFSKNAFSDLGDELRQVGKKEDAIAAYQKHLEIVPLDPAVHKSLGTLLASSHRDAEARAELEVAARITPDDPQIKVALAQLYARAGETEKAHASAKAVTGSETLAGDMFNAALRDDIDPSASARDSRRSLDDIGDHFDSGDYEQLTSGVFAAMPYIALAWARIGWADFLQGDHLEGLKFLDSAWLLSQSGAVANREGRIYQKLGQRERAIRMFAMSVAAGGPDTQSSEEELEKLTASPAAAQEEVKRATGELTEMNSVKLPAITTKTAAAQFILVFNTSSHPEQVEYASGDEVLRAAASQLMSVAYPVKFPDVSAIKIVRRGTVSCVASGCSIMLAPPEKLELDSP